MEEETKVKTNAFTDSAGVLSIRRISAFILILSSIGFGLACILTGKDWKVLLTAMSVPLVGAIILLFFTTWSDIGNVVEKIRK